MTSTATTYTVTAFVNVGSDFFGFKHTDPIAQVRTFTITAANVRAAAEKMYAVGNRMAGDDTGRCWPADVRSLSVGDLVPVTGDRATTFLAVARFGFDEVLEPVNPIVPIGARWRPAAQRSRGSASTRLLRAPAASAGGRVRRSAASSCRCSPARRPEPGALTTASTP